MTEEVLMMAAASFGMTKEVLMMAERMRGLRYD